MSQASDVRETATHCDHRHADVTQQGCGMCWLRLEGDAGCMRLATMLLSETVSWCSPVPVLFGWDACRAKHLNPDTRAQASAEEDVRETRVPIGDRRHDHAPLLR